MTSNTKTNQWQGVSSDLDQTINIGKTLASFAKPGDLIALNGELGAGKTQLVRGLALGLNIDAQLVASPTFVMVHEYLPELENSDSPALIHIDAYRLTSLEDLESIGWDIAEAGGPEFRDDCIVAIEWAEKIQQYLGEDLLEVKLNHLDGNEREIIVTAEGNWIPRMEKLSKSLADIVAKQPTTQPPPTAEKHLCPICGKVVRDDDDIFPFCSERCRKIDLGKWLGGDYIISRPIDQADLDEV